MEKDAKVLAVDGEFGADLFAVGLVEKEAFEDPAVLGGELGENLADGSLPLAGDECSFEVDPDIGQVGKLFFGSGVFLLAAQRFEDDVFRYGVDEGGETFYGGAAPNVDEDAEESFLTDIVDELPRTQLETKAGLKDRSEVSDEMGFGVRLAVPKTRQIIQIERQLLHRRPGSLHGISRPGDGAEKS